MNPPQFATRINRVAGLTNSLKLLLECVRDLDHPGPQLIPAIFLATEIEYHLEQIINPGPSAPITGANDQ